MPRYKNISNKTIYLEFDDLSLDPGKEANVRSFYKKDGLKLLDINPYIFPVDISEDATCTKKRPKEYEVIDKSKIKILALKNDIRIYFNEYKEDSKYILVKQGMIYELINPKNYIYKLYITPHNTKSATFYILITNKYDNQFNF